MILLNPGPVNLCPSVREAATKLDLCHRQEEFIDILLDVKRRLLKISNKNSANISILHGSGALAVESAIHSLVRGKILIIDNGYYCCRIRDSLLQLSKYQNIQVTSLSCGFGLAPDMNKLSELLKQKFDWVTVVHHETSTGLLNPLTDICNIAELYDTKVFVDAVSSFGIHSTDTRSNIICFNSNKCLESLPGAAIIIWDKFLKCHDTNEYMKLSNYIDDKIPYTPNTNAIIALQEALNCYDNENRPERYKTICKHIRQVGSKYYKLFLNNNYSDVLTSFSFSGNYDLLYAKAKANGFILYPGKMCGYFRVANINPILTKSHIDDLFSYIGEFK
jgi:2-aminoethylphosphonate-pyruvate transaminase